MKYFFVPYSDQKKPFLSCMPTSTSASSLKGELQRENKLISYKERSCISLELVKPFLIELLSFDVRSGNHQTGISLLQKFSKIFEHIGLISPKMTSQLTSHNFQTLEIEIFSKPCKI